MLIQITKSLWGIPFVLGGLLIMFLGFELSTLECNRLRSTEIDCKLTSTNLLSTNTTLIAPGKLQGAEVKKRKNAYRVMLLTESEIIPLTQSYTIGKQGKVNQANQINLFVSDIEQKSLTIRQDNRWFGSLFGVIFILSGICAILYPDLITVNRRR